jgi:hypothetical protein
VDESLSLRQPSPACDDTDAAELDAPRSITAWVHNDISPDASAAAGAALAVAASPGQTLDSERRRQPRLQQRVFSYGRLLIGVSVLIPHDTAMLVA